MHAWNGAREDPKRRGDRPSRHRQDLTGRGPAVRVGDDEPARERHREVDGLRPRRRGAPARHVDLGVGHPPRVGGPHDQPDRHAGRAELPGRRARRAAGGRGRDRVRLGRAWASRSAPSASGGAATSSGSRGSCSSTCSTASGPTSSRRSRRSRRGSRRSASPSSSRSAASTSSTASSTSSTWSPTTTARARGHDEPIDIPDDLRAIADEYHDKLMDVVVRDVRRAHGALPGGRRDHPRRDGRRDEEARHRGRALPGRMRRGDPQHRLARPARPDRRGSAVARSGAATCPRWATRARSRTCSRRSPTRSAARSTCCASSRATVTSDSTLVNNHTHSKERIGQLLTIQGKEHAPIDVAVHGRDRRRREAQGDRDGRRALRRPTRPPRSSRWACPRRSCRSRSSRSTRATRRRS